MVLISAFYFSLRDYDYESGALCNVPAYVPAFVESHCVYPWRDG